MINYYIDLIEKTAAENTKDLSKLDKFLLSARIKKIQKCKDKNKLLKLTYLDKKGVKSTRNVEPYRLDENDFWGYDTDKGSIRRFKVRNIKGVKPLNISYTPRWDD